MRADSYHIKGFKRRLFLFPFLELFPDPFQIEKLYQVLVAFLFCDCCFWLERQEANKSGVCCADCRNPSPQNSGCFPASVFQGSVMVGAAGKGGWSGVNEYICLLRETS